MKKDILISVYDMEIGGIERSLINMLESFDYEQYNVDLLIYSHQGDFMKLIPGKVNILPEISEYTVFRKPLKQCIQEGHYAATLIRLLSRNIALVKAKRRKLQEGPGYIQMQLASKYTSYIIPALKKKYHLTISYAWPHDILASKVKAQKKVAWIHTDYSKLEIDNKLDLTVWNKFDYIASISEACTESFLQQYPSLEKKITVIENITSPTFIKNMAEEALPASELDNDTFKIISVGRLSFVKGFDMAVQALKSLHLKGFTQLKWYIVGYGGYEAELKELISLYGMQESFILLGKKANPYPYIKNCDLYVQPSRYEGKAVTVTEAQILGKPVLITNYPTARSQVIDGYNGLICEISPEAIAERIEQLFLNAELRARLSVNNQDHDYNNNRELDKLYSLIG